MHRAVLAYFFYKCYVDGRQHGAWVPSESRFAIGLSGRNPVAAAISWKQFVVRNQDGK